MDYLEETPLPRPRLQARVFAADGVKIGTIVAVGSDFMAVERGLFFPTDFYIPLDAIAACDPHQVILTVPLNAALAREWAAGPTEGPAFLAEPEGVTIPEPTLEPLLSPDDTGPEMVAPLIDELPDSAKEREIPDSELVSESAVAEPQPEPESSGDSEEATNVPTESEPTLEPYNEMEEPVSGTAEREPEVSAILIGDPVTDPGTPVQTDETAGAPDGENADQPSHPAQKPQEGR